MGTWTVWHFTLFFLVAGIGGLRARGHEQPVPSTWGGWLAIVTLFLLYWAAQELAEFYRVRHEVSVLVPSSFNSSVFQDYLTQAYRLAWLQAILLAVGAGLLALCRRSWVPRAVMGLMVVAGPIVTATELMLSEHYLGDFLIDDDYSSLLATSLFTLVFSLYLGRSRRAAARWPR